MSCIYVCSVILVRVVYLFNIYNILAKLHEHLLHITKYKMYETLHLFLFSLINDLDLELLSCFRLAHHHQFLVQPNHLECLVCLRHYKLKL